MQVLLQQPAKKARLRPVIFGTCGSTCDAQATVTGDNVVVYLLLGLQFGAGSLVPHELSAKRGSGCGCGCGGAEVLGRLDEGPSSNGTPAATARQ